MSEDEFENYLDTTEGKEFFRCLCLCLTNFMYVDHSKV